VFSPRQGFREKGSRNLFGNVVGGGGQLSLRQDDAVPRQLRAELLDMGFPQDDVDAVMTRGLLSKVGLHAPLLCVCFCLR
jgi:hypothetical protein